MDLDFACIKLIPLKSEIHVPLKSSPSDLYRNKDSIEWPPEEILNKFRDYILRGKNIQRPNVDASVSTVLTVYHFYGRIC